MSKLEFKPATRRQLKVKVGLMGTAGTGKTWNALAIAEALVPGGTIYVIDSERGRAEAYAGDFTFKHLALPSYSPETYIEALSLANDEGADVVIADSISHEWVGSDGILPSVDRFGGWKDATPRHDAFVDALFRLPRHVIATMRAKTQYQVEEVERGGRKRQEIIKLGVGPVQRDNLEYEFDLLMMMELDHSARLHKSVIGSLPSGSLLAEEGDDPRALGRRIAFAIKEWTEYGEKVEAPTEADEVDVEFLTRLLNEEGFDNQMIEGRFAKRRLELGALTEAYVKEQITLSRERLDEKGIDITQLLAEFGTDDANGGPEAGLEGHGEAGASNHTRGASKDSESVTEPSEPSSEKTA